MDDVKRLCLITLGFGVFLISAWLGLQVGWYCFFVPSSLQEAKQTIESSQCNSLDHSSQFKCQAAYEYIRKNKM